MTKVPEPDQGHRTRTNVRLHETAPGSFVVRGAVISPTTGRYITSTQDDTETDADPQDTP